MNKRRLLILVLAVVVLSVGIFAGCSSTDEEKYQKDLEKNIEKLVSSYGDIKDSFAGESVYSYKVSYEYEEMANFDFENKQLPGNKEPSENKKWNKPLLEYEFVKSGADWYAKSVYKDTKKDENGLPTFSDKSGKKPEYRDPVTTEYWFVQGVLKVYVNGSKVYEGTGGGFDISNYSIDGDISLGYGDILKDKVVAYAPKSEAMFSASTRKWFSETILTYQTYYVSDLTSDGLVPFKNSDFTSGFGEDLSFDWEKISGAYSEIICFTAKKGRLVQFEEYTEAISSNWKKSTQIWNNQEVTNWAGDRTAAAKIVFNISYPDKKTSISVPAINY